MLMDSPKTHRLTSLHTWALRGPRGTHIVISVGLLLAISVLGFLTHQSHTFRQVIVSHTTPKLDWITGTSHTSIRDVQNQTLGFAKVIVIGMPNRSDKRDAMALAASYSGIEFEWSDGVKGADIPAQAIPNGWAADESNATLGCWRAHMNVAQRVVKEKLQSVLIMEDDADWDVNIKTQLVEIARGAHYIQDMNELSEGTLSTHSPYGDDWDLIWLGHCGVINRPKETAKHWVIQDDPTAVPQKSPYYSPGRRVPFLSPPLLHGNFTRYVFEVSRGLCMPGYALSYRGAQRLLYHQSIAGEAIVSDRAINKVCGPRYMGMKCLATFPRIIGSHRAAGPTNKDSDRVDYSGKVRTTSETANLVFPAKVNLERLIGAKDGMVPSQFPNDTMLPEMKIGAELPRGEGVVIEPWDYEL